MPEETVAPVTVTSATYELTDVVGHAMLPPLINIIVQYAVPAPLFVDTIPVGCGDACALWLPPDALASTLAPQLLILNRYMGDLSAMNLDDYSGLNTIRKTSAVGMCVHPVTRDVYLSQPHRIMRLPAAAVEMALDAADADDATPEAAAIKEAAAPLMKVVAGNELHSGHTDDAIGYRVQFDTPSGIACAGGRGEYLLVADRMNRRIRKVQLVADVDLTALQAGKPKAEGDADTAAAALVELVSGGVGRTTTVLGDGDRASDGFGGRRKEKRDKFDPLRVSIDDPVHIAVEVAKPDSVFYFANGLWRVIWRFDMTTRVLTKLILSASIHVSSIIAVAPYQLIASSTLHGLYMIDTGAADANPIPTAGAIPSASVSATVLVGGIDDTANSDEDGGARALIQVSSCAMLLADPLVLPPPPPSAAARAATAAAKALAVVVAGASSANVIPTAQRWLDRVWTVGGNGCVYAVNGPLPVVRPLL